MKTKLLLSAIFFLAIAESALSQEYHPLLNKSSWVVNDMVACCTPPEIKIINEGIDEVIGDYTYKKYVDPFPMYDSATSSYIDYIYLREDVIDRKVYKIVNGTDALLYDFSMENGDIVSQYGYTWTATVDNIEITGGTRKRITLNSIELWCNHSLTQVWIEGVGTNAHPFYPERNMYSIMASGGGYNIYTKCSFQDGEHIFGEAECESFAPLSTNENHYSGMDIVLYPNPFVNELTIDSGIELQNATFKLYNLRGQLVREVNKLKGTKIVIARENLGHGMYFAELSENGKSIKSAKIMVD